MKKNELCFQKKNNNVEPKNASKKIMILNQTVLPNQTIPNQTILSNKTMIQNQKMVPNETMITNEIKIPKQTVLQKRRIRFTAEDNVELLRLVVYENPYKDETKWVNITEDMIKTTGKQFTIRGITDHLEYEFEKWNAKNNFNMKQ